MTKIIKTKVSIQRLFIEVIAITGISEQNTELIMSFSTRFRKNLGVLLFHIPHSKMFCLTLQAEAGTLLTASETLVKRGEVFSVFIS